MTYREMLDERNDEIMCDVRARQAQVITWNCAHLGPITYALARTYNDKHGLWTPHMVTPETIIEVITKEEWLKLQGDLTP